MSRLNVAIDKFKKTNPSTIEKHIARRLINQAKLGMPVVLYPESLNELADQMKLISKRSKGKQKAEFSANMKNLLDTCTRLNKKGRMSDDMYDKIKSRILSDK